MRILIELLNSKKYFMSLNKSNVIQAFRMTFISYKFYITLFFMITILLNVSHADNDTPQSFTVNSMFGNEMVVQRNMNVPVWGTSSDGGSKVTVSFRGQSVSTTSDEIGNWIVYLEPMKAGGPHAMTIKSQSETIQLEQVFTGDVWFCSGQSNMQWTAAQTNELEEILEQTMDKDWLKLHRIPIRFTEEVEQTSDSQWTDSSRKHVENFSAVALHFASTLKASNALENIPIGLIDASFGGMRVETFISEEKLNECDSENEAATSLFGVGPSMVYNGMIASVIPYAVRGVIWYQGESNTDTPDAYASLFNCMIEDWRARWNHEELPFYFVQLPNFNTTIGGNTFTGIREAQALVNNSVPFTGMAVSIDVGTPLDIHPNNKSEVGERLARIALAKSYDLNINYQGPEVQQISQNKNTLILNYDEEETLINANKPGPLRGFSVAGKDGLFYDAEATISQNSITVSSTEVSEPIYVRYAWSANPDADLYDSEGLPAIPYRNDDFPGSELEAIDRPPSYDFATPVYTSRVDSDGCLESIVFDGFDFLAEGHHLNQSRGTFFIDLLFGSPIKLWPVKKIHPNALKAQTNDVGAVYHFSNDSIRIQLTNKLYRKMKWQMVFAEDVKLKNDPENESVFSAMHEGKRIKVNGAKFQDHEWTEDHPGLLLEIEGNTTVEVTITMDHQLE